MKIMLTTMFDIQNKTNTLVYIINLTELIVRLTESLY